MRRGQAVTELALLLLVFVTAIIFGVHFAEVHALGMRTQEAAQAGLFDTTAMKMHDTSTGNWDLAKNVAIATAAASTLENYADREGRHAAPSRPTADWVFSRADEIEMDCGHEAGVDLAPVKPLDKSLPAGDTALGCTAGVLVKGWRIPLSFADKGAGGFFKKSHYEPLDYGLCAAGTSRNRECRQRYVILLDDWGYAGPKEGPECPLQVEGGDECADNRGYWHMVKRAYERQVELESNGKRTAGTALAKHTVGKSPIDENHFYLSFRGSESAFTDSLVESHHEKKWETTPWSKPSAYKKSKREACWLGLECK